MLVFNRYVLAYKLLVAYLYAMLFGSWFLKLFGISHSIGLFILSFLDILPLAIWFLSNPSFRIKTKDFFVDTFSFWVTWAILLVLLILSSLKKGGSITPALAHWGALIRYIPLAYIALSLSKNINLFDPMLRHLKIIAVILVLTGFACITLGENAVVFLPLLPEDATGLRETLEGNFSAYFANTIDYAFLLLVLYIILIYNSRFNKLTIIWLTIAFFIPIFRTGSAMATVVFIIIAFYRNTQGCLLIRLIVMFSICLFLPYIAYNKWTVVLSIIENAQLSRLGMLTLTGPDFISEMSFDSFFGIGCDGYVVLDKVNSYKEQVFMLKHVPDGNISSFGDVYWIALLVFHGLIGLCLIVYIFIRLFRATTGKKYSDNNFDYNRIIKWLFFAIIFLSFFNQIIVVKTFAIIFWIFLGMVYSKTIIINENTSDK